VIATHRLMPHSSEQPGGTMSYEGRSPFGRAFTAADNAAMTNLLGADLAFRSPAATKPYHGANPQGPSHVFTDIR
jgi:hypothetical protein